MILKTEDPNLRFQIHQKGTVAYRLKLQRLIFALGPIRWWLSEGETTTFRGSINQDKQKLMSKYRKREAKRNQPPRPPIHEELRDI